MTGRCDVCWRRVSHSPDVAFLGYGRLDAHPRIAFRSCRGPLWQVVP